MDLPDEVGQPGVPDRAGRGRAVLAVVVARLGDVEHAADELDGQALCRHYFRRREPPFGPTSSFSNSTARRLTASSASKSAMRFLAAVSSAFSPLVSPATRPRSMRS